MSGGIYLSAPLVGNAYIAWALKPGSGSGSIRVGLATSAQKATNTLTDFAYALRYESGHFYAQEGSTYTDLGAYASTAIPRIQYDGVKVIYIIDGVAVRSQTVSV